MGRYSVCTFSLDMTGAAAVVRIAYAVVGPLCQLGGPIVARLAIFLYRKLLARPIDVRSPRPKEPSKNNVNTLPCVYTMRTWI